MEKFFKSTFDAITNVLPGAFILFVAGFFLFDDPKNLVNYGKELNFGIGALLVFVAYIVGFIILPIGQFIFIKIGLKLFPVRLTDQHIDLTISEKFSLVREFSPANFAYIETWNMFSSLSYCSYPKN